MTAETSKKTVLFLLITMCNMVLNILWSPLAQSGSVDNAVQSGTIFCVFSAIFSKAVVIITKMFQTRNFFLHQLLSMPLPNLTLYPDNLLQAATQWWREGLITNFELVFNISNSINRIMQSLS